MGLISISRDEMDNLDKTMKDQARVIREQHEMLERLMTESEVNEGWMLFTARHFFQSQVMYAQAIITLLAPAPPVVNEDADVKTSRENIQKQTLTNFDRASRNLADLDPAWTDFCRDKPVAAEILKKRYNIELIKEVAHHGR